MSILSGLLLPDSGTVSIGGRDVRFRHPREAIAAGIGMVHQHFALIPTLNAVENVVLGREPRSALGFLDGRSARSQVAALAERLRFRVELERPVGELPVGMRQKVELLRVLYRGTQTLILDEPTGVLSDREIAELFDLLRTLRQEGCAVILITHKLQEVRAVADEVVLMRAGRTLSQTGTEELSIEALSAQLLGDRTLPQALTSEKPIHDRSAPPLLELVEVGAGALSLQLRAGEILGIAGIEGNGQSAWVQLLAGLHRPTTGEIRWRGEPIADFSPRAMQRRGIQVVHADRHARGLLGSMSVEENLSLGMEDRPPFAWGPWLDRAGRRAAATQSIAHYEIRPASPVAATSQLSGGNQQKVVLARALASRPQLLVAEQPTRGLDLVATAQLRQAIRAASAEGMAVLWFSSDLDELLAVSDQLRVLSQGRLSPPMARGAVDLQTVGRWMMAGDETR